MACARARKRGGRACAGRARRAWESGRGARARRCTRASGRAGEARARAPRADGRDEPAARVEACASPGCSEFRSRPHLGAFKVEVEPEFGLSTRHWSRRALNRDRTCAVQQFQGGGRRRHGLEGLEGVQGGWRCARCGDSRTRPAWRRAGSEDPQDARRRRAAQPPAPGIADSSPQVACRRRTADRGWWWIDGGWWWIDGGWSDGGGMVKGGGAKEYSKDAPQTSLGPAAGQNLQSYSKIARTQPCGVFWRIVRAPAATVGETLPRVGPKRADIGQSGIGPTEDEIGQMLAGSNLASAAFNQK